MLKFITRLLPVVAILGAATTVQSCSDDDEKTPAPVPPTATVSVKDVQRTQATFEIISNDAADYAYIVAEKSETAAVTDAEELFENGTVGYLTDGKADVTTFDIEGGKEYEIYAAVRKINPYVYSEIIRTDLNTDIPYTAIATLNKVGLTDISYHLEMPANAEQVMHVLVKEADYEAIKSLLAMFGDVSMENYLKVFGHTVTESQDIEVDKITYTGWDDVINIHTGTTYLLLAGVRDESGSINPDSFECIKFNTRKADDAPYNIEISATATSITAEVSVTPDPEFVEYRMIVDKKSEFDYVAREGEAQLRNFIVGRWNDEDNTPKRVKKGAVTTSYVGLVPNTQYNVGVIGYDSQRREKFVLYEFVTGEPTGPKPTVTIVDATPSVESPWSTKAFNVKVTNANSAIYGFFKKSQVDQVLSGGASMSDIVKNNGYNCGGTQIEQMLTADGAIFEVNTLEPETEYIFGIYAQNEEYVSACETVAFATEELPVIGGDKRKNMPGKYIASTTDEEGNTVTFPVTIATGADDATSAEYSALNRLVAFGFGPADQFPYQSPADLVSAGMDSETARASYGPKWFIEFKSEDEISIPCCQDDNRAYTWKMCQVDGSDAYMYGIAIRPSTGRDMPSRVDTFPIEVSDDFNTITVKGSYLESQKCYYYPIMLTPGSGWFSPETVHFRCYSELVLTRDNSNAAKACVHNSALRLPTREVINFVGDNSKIIDSERAAFAEKLNK